jgi:hypothetical protein
MFRDSPCVVFSQLSRMLELIGFRPEQVRGKSGLTYVCW